MRRILIAAAAVLAFAYLPAMAADDCTTIQSGDLVASNGDPLETGYDSWGYNYQGHMFRGPYCKYDRDSSDCDTYGDIQLIMKWNEPWLSNMDCDGDSKLDRHYGFPAYEESGAWVTNHMKGKCWQRRDNGRDKLRTWTYFVKIVAAPEDAYQANGNWYTAEDVEIGPIIWGAFAIVEQIEKDFCCSYRDENDNCIDVHGRQFLSPYTPGFGAYKPK